jgi:hypothetical protein
MFNESIRWIEQSQLNAKIGGEAALFFNNAGGAADPPTNVVGQSLERAIPRFRGWRAGRGAQPSWQEARELREWSGRCGR